VDFSIYHKINSRFPSPARTIAVSGPTADDLNPMVHLVHAGIIVEGYAVRVSPYLCLVNGRCLLIYRGYEAANYQIRRRDFNA
jgi:hypothetical protein